MTSSANNPRARPGGPLTPREREILALVAAGEPTTAIAVRLSISENTVKGHLTHVYAKTGSRNRVQATRHYLDHYAAASTERSAPPVAPPSRWRKNQRAQPFSPRPDPRSSPGEP